MQQAAHRIPRPGFLLPAAGLWHREVVRFLRQRNRVAGALLTPFVFWLLLGAGLGSSFRGAGDDAYLSYFFPGTLVLVVFFTAIYSTISIIEDRKEGDRDDESIKELVQVTWDMKPDHIIVKEMTKYLRGREAGAVAGIIRDEFRSTG